MADGSKFSKNVVILGFVSFLNDMASEMVYPVVPVFLTSVLGAPAYILGVVEGIADFLSKILMAFFGLASDRKQQRKPFVVWGYSLAASSHLIMALAKSWPVVLLARAINRTGKGVRTAARDALITESTEKIYRGRWFGFHRTLDNLGAVIGPLVSIYLLSIFSNSYPKLFFSAFLPGLLGVVILALFVKEKTKDPIGFMKMKFEWGKANESFKIFLLISFIFGVGNSSYGFMLLRAQNLGLSIGLTIFTYVLLNFTHAVFSLPAGIAADRLGARKVLILGYFVFATVYLLFGFTSSSLLPWLLFPLYGIFLALTDSIGPTYISKLVPHEIAASAFGIYQTTMGFAALFASVIAGLLWTFVDERAPFYFGGGVAVVAALLFISLSKKVKTVQPVA